VRLKVVMAAMVFLRLESFDKLLGPRGEIRDSLCPSY
jgi:hypothetical protein